ncbi:MAG: hypothetical protein AAGG51_07030 [Cyanobacteria bacterium P01_G01_bin.54]
MFWQLTARFQKPPASEKRLRLRTFVLEPILTPGGILPLSLDDLPLSDDLPSSEELGDDNSLFHSPLDFRTDIIPSITVEASDPSGLFTVG